MTLVIVLRAQRRRIARGARRIGDGGERGAAARIDGLSVVRARRALPHPRWRRPEGSLASVGANPPARGRGGFVLDGLVRRHGPVVTTRRTSRSVRHASPGMADGALKRPEKVGLKVCSSDPSGPRPLSAGGADGSTQGWCGVVRATRGALHVPRRIGCVISDRRGRLKRALGATKNPCPREPNGLEKQHISKRCSKLTRHRAHPPSMQNKHVQRVPPDTS
jgi:hypothetical protein